MAGRLKTINGQGFCDAEEFVYDDFLPDKFRVLALGDSFTFGMSADLGKSWIDVLETGLRRKFDSAVWNTGIPATGTKQALSALNKFGPILKPNLIVYGFFVNDFRDNLYPVDIFYRTNGGEAIMRYEIDKDFNLRGLIYDEAVLRACNIDLNAGPFEKFLYKTSLYSLFVDARAKLSGKKWIYCDEATVLEREMRITQELLYRLREWSAKNDSELVVLLIPYREDLNQTRVHYAAARKTLRAMKINCIEVKGSLSAEDYAEPPDPHWNSSGHAKAGNAVLDYISMRRLVPDRNAIKK